MHRITRVLLVATIGSCGATLLGQAQLGGQLSASTAPTTSLGLGPAAPFDFGLYVAGNATLSGDATGSVAVGGNLTAHNLTVATNCGASCPWALVAPSITAGSDLNVTTGNWAVAPAPSTNTYHLYNNGSGSQTLATQTAPISFAGITDALQADADAWASMTSTGSASYTHGGSVLALNGSNPKLNVFNLNTSAVRLPVTQTTVEIAAPATSTVLINVDAAWSANIARLTSFLSLVPTNRVIWNFGHVATLAFGTPQWLGTILAPSAAFTGGGEIDGDLIVGSIAPFSPRQNNPEVHAVTNLFTGNLPQPPFAPTAPQTTPSLSPGPTPAQTPSESVTTSPTPRTSPNSQTASAPSPVRLVTGPPQAPKAVTEDLFWGIAFVLAATATFVIERHLRTRKTT